ncbi:HET-domain-containing protein [Lentithecium fluviatile CBS 122367]|uniref:HET-domain-containing protein n=1 Tax=Lentithecium fluviatile CBS 122367 TaxID=1168545 RepID=A0A6G1JAE0_9PLEO|nr:HET-domain-containing protein [Lentithecium fluviatile CBS 122367]
MICDKCSHLFRGLGGQPLGWRTEHYSSYAELNHSANTGCGVCAIFERVLLEYYAHALCLTTDEAKIYHQDYDEAESWENCSETDASSSSDAMSLSNITEAEPTSFFIELLFCDIDPTFASQHAYHQNGLQGINYVRCRLRDHYTPDEVYPFLDISSLSGSPTLSQWNIVGKKVSPDPDLRLAQHWIDDCRKNHGSCAQLSDPPLPTRVLDLTALDDTLDLRLMVSSGKTGQYATLSHCWGTTYPIVLTLDTLEQFQKRIVFSELQPTFRDAVTVARSLKLRFLWIDSLCIIQKSSKDWEEQCARMAQIYKNAIVTLAGPAAAGCNTGFLHSRPAICQVTEVSDGAKPDNITLSHYGFNEDCEVLLPEHNSPLAKRGWVLQERLLSCRILYFGSSLMYLECFQNVRFENCHVPITWNYQKTDMVTKSRIERLQTDSDRFQYWRHILETYSPMLLTKPTDRLPALSGLASEIKKATNAEYLAGVWREDLIRGLAWCIPSYAWEESSPVVPSQDYIAPSWSWAAAKHRFTLGSFANCISAVGDIDIAKSQVSLAGLDRFGQVQDGFIEVQGRTKSVVLRNLPDRCVPGRRMFCVQSEDDQSDVLARYSPDCAYPADQADLEVMLLYLGHYLTKNEKIRYAALGIKATGGGQDEYRRIGLAYTELDEGYEFPKMFESLSRRKLRIV